MKVKHLLAITVLVLVTIGVVTFFSSSDSNNTGKPVFMLAIDGKGKEQLLKDPTYAVADERGNIWVADSGNGRVQMFDKKGRFKLEIGGSKAKQKLLYPYGLGLLGSNKIIIADVGANALYEFDRKGRYIKTWLTPEVKIQPAGVFVAKDKTVYVTDIANGLVLVFSGDGKIQKKIKPSKVALDSPQGIAVTDDGIWVADGANYNVKLYGFDGELKTIFDGGPNWPLTMAKGLALDKQGRIYVADTFSNIIRVFDKNGNNLFNLGSGNSNKTGFLFPVGISVDDNGKIYIADQGNNQIQVWSW